MHFCVLAQVFVRLARHCALIAGITLQENNKNNNFWYVGYFQVANGQVEIF